MPAQLNHHIVHARDPEASARFMTEILGLPPATRFGPFTVVQAANGVSLDFIATDDERYLVPNHWADPDGHWLEIITRPYGSAH
jgi:catechol 2,3-dioxygenase-like lactoylglutathione lyase family enzyme